MQFLLAFILAIAPIFTYAQSVDNSSTPTDVSGAQQVLENYQEAFLISEQLGSEASQIVTEWLNQNYSDYNGGRSSVPGLENLVSFHNFAQAKIRLNETFASCVPTELLKYGDDPRKRLMLATLRQSDNPNNLKFNKSLPTSNEVLIATAEVTDSIMKTSIHNAVYSEINLAFWSQNDPAHYGELKNDLVKRYCTGFKNHDGGRIFYIETKPPEMPSQMAIACQEIIESEIAKFHEATTLQKITDDLNVKITQINDAFRNATSVHVATDEGRAQDPPRSREARRHR